MVILTGADPAFCAGLDLKELGAGEQDLSDSPAAPGGDPTVARGPLPVIGKPIIGRSTARPSPVGSSWR